MNKKLKLLLKNKLCKQGYHIWQDKFNPEDAWHECCICGWQIAFSKEELDALRSMNRHIFNQ